MIVVRFGSISRRCISLKTPLLDSRVIGILLVIFPCIAEDVGQAIICFLVTSRLPKGGVQWHH